MSYYTATLEKAAKWASIEFNRLITVQSLRAKTKAQTHTQPRWYVMAYMHATGRFSMPQIARALHLEDHTTVLYGLRRAHGYDGKPAHRKHTNTPLWDSERFKNMVAADFPVPIIRVNAYEREWDEGTAKFINSRGWAS